MISPKDFTFSFIDYLSLPPGYFAYSLFAVIFVKNTSVVYFCVLCVGGQNTCIIVGTAAASFYFSNYVFIIYECDQHAQAYSYSTGGGLNKDKFI